MNRSLMLSVLTMALSSSSEAPDLPSAQGGGVRSFDKKDNVKWNPSPSSPLSFDLRVPVGRLCPKNAKHGPTRARYCPTCKARVQPPKR